MKLDNLVDSQGRRLPQHVEQDLRAAILRTITHPECDVDAVMARARGIARRAADGQIRDVLRYATKALFAVARKESRLFAKESAYCVPPNALSQMAGEAVEGSVASIEARILANELLKALPQIERAVFLRYTMGWKHQRIGKELQISPAMSSYYLLRAKARLDAALKGARRDNR